MKIFFTSRYGGLKQIGGDTLHLITIARQLEALGHQVFLEKWPFSGQQPDVIHHFNLGRPELALKAIARFPEVPFMVQTIFVDYSPIDRTTLLRKWLLGFLKEGRVEMFKEWVRWSKRQRPFPYWKYWLKGHNHSIQELLNHAHFVLSASQAEFLSISTRFQVASDKFQLSLPPLREPFDARLHFETTSRSGGICIGRLEPLKNQLALIEAWDTERMGTLHIVGAPAPNHHAYAEKCKRLGRPKGVVFLPHQSPIELADLLRTKKVHVLVSLYETTGLATVEALASGCQTVVSDHPIQHEIFAEHAHFAKPSSSESIIQAVECALQSSTDHSEWAQKKFSVSDIVGQIEQLYKRLQ